MVFHLYFGLFLDTLSANFRRNIEQAKADLLKSAFH